MVAQFLHRHEPHHADALPVLDATELLAKHAARIAALRKAVGIPDAHWKALYLSVLETFAQFVQQLPASEAHHHCGIGGLLEHAIDVTCKAIVLRQGHQLPAGASTEEIAKKRDLWTYAVAMGALLHDIGKPLTDQRVNLFDASGRSLGPWNPWVGPMPDAAASYRVTFLRERRYRLHERVPLLMERLFLRPEGLRWLGSDLDVLQAFLSVLGNDPDGAGVLGELVRQSDGLSVAENLPGGVAARLPTAQARSLAERLLTGLRYLLGEGVQPLNRPGAAGWFTGDALWLVSKRVLDALREHLAREGQTGIPTRNDRLMDELQQHGLLVPNGDRAIWTARITDGEWSHELTLLRFAAHILWPEASARPTVFAGTVVPVENSHEGSPMGSTATEITETDARIATISQTTTATAPHTGEESTPAPSRETDESPDTESADDIPIRENAADLGDRFLAWLKDGIGSGRLILNARNARVHVTTDGLLLVSPAIFKDFDPAHWADAQKRFQKRKLHKKTEAGTNIWMFAVIGERKHSTINGLLIPDPKRVLEMSLPEPNPHLSLIMHNPQEKTGKPVTDAG